MKAITVRQPWAWCIAAGHKLVENRTWVTHYRGPLAIHAGATVERESLRTVKQYLVDQGVLQSVDELVGDRHLLATGAVLAVVNLTGICTDSARCHCGRWAAIGQNHWKLANVVPLAEPVPARGQQGLWEIDLPAVSA